MNESNRQLRQESDEKERKITRYKDRIHVLEGCIFAVEHSVEVLEMMLESVATFKQKLSRTYGLSEIQIQCIADMRLRVYAKDDKEKLYEEYEEYNKVYRMLLLHGKHERN